jgi:hypothetical protein
MAYGVLADLVVAVHFCFVGFVVIGQILIWFGVALQWNWVRNPWFRIAHLIAILIVGLEALGHVACPLTLWEIRLRELAGQPIETSSFVGRLFHAAIFVDVDPATLDKAHIAFALLVLGTFVFWPPVFRRKLHSSWPAERKSKL